MNLDVDGGRLKLMVDVCDSSSIVIMQCPVFAWYIFAVIILFMTGGVVGRSPRKAPVLILCVLFDFALPPSFAGFC